MMQNKSLLACCCLIFGVCLATVAADPLPTLFAGPGLPGSVPGPNNGGPGAGVGPSINPPTPTLREAPDPPPISAVATVAPALLQTANTQFATVAASPVGAALAASQPMSNRPEGPGADFERPTLEQPNLNSFSSFSPTTPTSLPSSSFSAPGAISTQQLPTPSMETFRNYPMAADYSFTQTLPAWSFTQPSQQQQAQFQMPQQQFTQPQFTQPTQQQQAQFQPMQQFQQFQSPQFDQQFAQPQFTSFTTAQPQFMVQQPQQQQALGFNPYLSQFSTQPSFNPPQASSSFGTPQRFTTMPVPNYAYQQGAQPQPLW